jgi:hypothetical protein
LKRIALSRENDYRRHLLSECLEAYVNLDEAQQQQFQALLNTESYQEAKPIMTITYKRGKNEGRLEGIIEERRKNALRFLKKKFGPLALEVEKRVLERTPELLDASSLKELRLED